MEEPRNPLAVSPIGAKRAWCLYPSIERQSDSHYSVCHVLLISFNLV